MTRKAALECNLLRFAGALHAEATIAHTFRLQHVYMCESVYACESVRKYVCAYMRNMDSTQSTGSACAFALRLRIEIMGYFKMRHVSVSVSVSIADWMKRHGYAIVPELSKHERVQLQECFALMDGDGSGAIDVNELYSAFKILGLHVSRQAVAELLAKVDADGSGEFNTVFREQRM